MSLVISDEMLDSIRMSPEELRKELAVQLFQTGRLTLAQAGALAEMPQLQFQHLLASRGITVHYGVEDLEADMKTLRSLGRL
ncbi:MAG TPA: hypothetical protein DCM87_20600 [Planctomycetes bacterium]|nr:hypothetical protein [Planctomycetota bacterium]